MHIVHDVKWPKVTGRTGNLQGCVYEGFFFFLSFGTSYCVNRYAAEPLPTLYSYGVTTKVGNTKKSISGW